MSNGDQTAPSTVALTGFTVETGLTVEEAIRGRQSIRAYLDQPVPRDVITRILETSGRAPSGSNIQPWKVWVIEGAP